MQPVKTLQPVKNVPLEPVLGETGRVGAAAELQFYYGSSPRHFALDCLSPMESRLLEPVAPLG